MCSQPGLPRCATSFLKLIDCSDLLVRVLLESELIGSEAGLAPGCEMQMKERSKMPCRVFDLSQYRNKAAVY